MVKIDMKMPKACSECRFIDCSGNNGEYPFCLALRENRGYTFDTRTKRFPNCPLHDVEDPNDILKENDEMLKIMFRRCKVMGCADGAMCVFCGLKDECNNFLSRK